MATNVAARGIDVTDIELVINYELPENASLFTHRIGRTGRMGREGEAITLLSPSEQLQWRKIERDLGRKIATENWDEPVAERPVILEPVRNVPNPPRSAPRANSGDRRAEQGSRLRAGGRAGAVNASRERAQHASHAATAQREEGAQKLPNTILRGQWQVLVLGPRVPRVRAADAGAKRANRARLER